jgi:hypothetical protein
MFGGLFKADGELAGVLGRKKSNGFASENK